MGYVYLINEWGSNNYKIGVTKSNDIIKRKKKLQTGNSSELVICREFDTKTPFKLEKLLHKYYYGNNLINEWFELTDQQAIDFIQICEKYQMIIDYMVINNTFCNQLIISEAKEYKP